MVERSRQAYAAALQELRLAGDRLAPGFERGGDGTVCYGDVVDAASAAAALLAAVEGAGVVAFVDAERDVADRLVDDLRRLGVVEHRIGDTQPPLTRQQRRLLELLAGGASLGEAAAELRLSRRTADRRLAEARRVLGVRTTAEALVAFSRCARGAVSARTGSAGAR